MFRRVIYITLLLCCAWHTPLLAQSSTNEQLAAQYMQAKEFEKAIPLYETLYDQNPSSYIYNNYLSCLIAIQDFKTAEKISKKQIKNNPQFAKYQVDLGYVYLLSDQPSKAEKYFKELISNLSPSPQLISDLANSFLERNLTALAIETFEKGEKLLNDDVFFNMEMAEVYRKKNDYNNMLEQYMQLLKSGPDHVSSIQSRLQAIVVADGSGNGISKLLKESLIKYTQQHPDKSIYAEMLLWLAIQQKDFETALIQAKALDRRLKEYGERLINLGNIALENKSYNLAASCFEYVIHKGSMNFNFITAKKQLLQTRYLQALEGGQLNAEQLQKLELSYKQTLQELGQNNETIELVKQLAHIQAFYLNKPDTAAALLEKAMQIQGSTYIRSECKLELADIMLYKGDLWEASLLYSQVEKAFPHDPIGHAAKFKNAKLTFYAGEFNWSKAQLDILKAATSKLIANDALQLSLLIGDNIAADSSYDPLTLYTHADLHMFRMHDDSALMSLDTLERLYPFHPIADEVLLKQAEIYKRKGDLIKADSILTVLVTKFPKDILADDALYLRAQLNQYLLKNEQVAKECYYAIITDYSDSVFAAEARKQFRILRGDLLN